MDPYSAFKEGETALETLERFAAEKAKGAGAHLRWERMTEKEQAEHMRKMSKARWPKKR